MERFLFSDILPQQFQIKQTKILQRLKIIYFKIYQCLQKIKNTPSQLKFSCLKKKKKWSIHQNY